MIDQNLTKTNGHSAAGREFNRNGRKGREDKAAKGRKKLGVQSFFLCVLRVLCGKDLAEG